MSARVMNALGATNLERTICATAGIVGRVDGARRLARGRPRGVAATPATCSSGAGTRCRPRRTCGASCSTRARRARGSSSSTRSAAARRGWPTSTCARCPGTDAALAIGMMRAIVDAGLHDEDWCRAHADGYDELLATLGGTRSRTAPRSCGVDGRDDRARRARVRVHPARRCCGSASAPSATLGAPAAYSHDRLAARAHRRLAGPRRRLLVHPDRHRGGDQLRTRSSARTCGPARCARSTCRGSARRSPTRRSTRRSRRSSAGTRTRPRSRPTRSGCSRASRREDLFTVVLEQFMTDTAAARRRGAAGHHPARAPRRALLLGPPLRDLERAGDRAAWARRSRTPRPSACSPRASGSTIRCFGDSDDELVDAAARGLRRERPARARLDEGRPRPGPDARTRRAASAPRPAAWRCTRRLRAARRGGRRGARRALPAGADHAEDAPLPQLDLRQPAPPARGAAGARVVVQPGRRLARAASRTARRCASSTTAATSSCAARVSDDARPGVLVAPMGWWNRDYPGGRSAQATTPQLLTEEGNAPTSTTTASRCKPSRGLSPLEG